MNQEINTPSIETVHEYIKKFDQDKELAAVEDVLSELFERYPNNQILRDVLIKATALNSLYNTNIYAIVKVARHILDKNIDTKLRMGSLELVDEIARIDIGAKKRRNYSFASKYCHWHQPNKYPIYDSLVENILWSYKKWDNFMIFKRTELQQYQRYKEIIDNFREYFGLTQFNYKEIDKFLWKHAKELSLEK